MRRQSMTCRAAKQAAVSVGTNWCGQGCCRSRKASANRHEAGPETTCAQASSTSFSWLVGVAVSSLSFSILDSANSCIFRLACMHGNTNQPCRSVESNKLAPTHAGHIRSHCTIRADPERQTASFVAPACGLCRFLQTAGSSACTAPVTAWHAHAWPPPHCTCPLSCQSHTCMQIRSMHASFLVLQCWQMLYARIRRLACIKPLMPQTNAHLLQA